MQATAVGQQRLPEMDNKITNLPPLLTPAIEGAFPVSPHSLELLQFCMCISSGRNTGVFPIIERPDCADFV